MNILLLGSGGRESALAYKISRSPLCTRLFIAPGNGGTEAYGTNIILKPTDFEAVAAVVERENIDLLVVGNEDPLVAGIRDFFATRKPDLLIVGPRRRWRCPRGEQGLCQGIYDRDGYSYSRLSLLHRRNLG